MANFPRRLMSPLLFLGLILLICMSMALAKVTSGNEPSQSLTQENGPDPAPELNPDSPDPITVEIHKRTPAENADLSHAVHIREAEFYPWISIDGEEEVNVAKRAPEPEPEPYQPPNRNKGQGQAPTQSRNQPHNNNIRPQTQGSGTRGQSSRKKDAFKIILYPMRPRMNFYDKGPSPYDLPSGGLQNRQVPEGIQKGFDTVNQAVGVAQTGLDMAQTTTGLIAGTISNMRGIVALIKDGVDLLKMFGIGPKDIAILIDDRCSDCDLEVRCWGWKKDTGFFDLAYPDGLITKFQYWLPTNLPGYVQWIGYEKWTCEYHDRKHNRRVTVPAFGGTAPRDNLALYEIRDTGIVRMDVETGRLDIRVGQQKW